MSRGQKELKGSKESLFNTDSFFFSEKEMNERKADFF
jgi:hypothetical protein